MSAPVQTTVASQPNQVGSFLQQAQQNPAKMQALMDQLTNGGQATTNANATTPEALAAPQVQSPAPIVGSKVAPFLKVKAQDFFKSKGLEHDFSAANSVLSFVGKPVLDKLQGKGNWFSTQKSAYLRDIVSELSRLATADKKDSETPAIRAEREELAQDAFATLVYVATEIDHKETNESGFGKLFGFFTGGGFNSNNDTTTAELQKSSDFRAKARTALVEFAKKQPSIAVQNAVSSFLGHQDKVILKDVLNAAIDADAEKAKTGRALAIGSLNVDHFGEEPQLKAGKTVLTELDQAFTAKSIQIDTAASAEKLTSIDAKLAEYK